MLLKKINPVLEKNLLENGVTELTDFQKSVISKIKSGTNLWVTAPENKGKTTAMLIGVIQKLKARPEGDNPRAIIFVSNDNEAIKLEQIILSLIKKTNLRLYTVIEKHHIYNQKDMIYIGTDIVIATPKRLSKLYFQNGINLNQLNTIVVDNATEIHPSDLIGSIARIIESVPKAQRIVVAQKETPSLLKAQQTFMETAQEVSAS